jgi:DNA-binding Lrp family transcriptional regulator
LQLDKKIDLQKDVVAYRVKRLVEDGIIFKLIDKKIYLLKKKIIVLGGAEQ